VYLIGRWAIKRPVFVEWRLFLLGLLANMQEARFSRMQWPELCPVLFACPGGFFIVMRRAQGLSRSEFEAFSEMKYLSFVDKPDYRVPVENKLDSFGWLDRRIVAVDYG
jgi:hypothetical protein